MPNTFGCDRLGNRGSSCFGPGNPMRACWERLARQGGSYSRELCFSHIRYLAFEPESCGWIYLAAAATAAPGRLWIYSNV